MSNPCCRPCWNGPQTCVKRSQAGGDQILCSASGTSKLRGIDSCLFQWHKYAAWRCISTELCTTWQNQINVCSGNFPNYKSNKKLEQALQEEYKALNITTIPANLTAGAALVSASATAFTTYPITYAAKALTTTTSNTPSNTTASSSSITTTSASAISTTATLPQGKGSNLSGGGIAGVVIGVLVIILLLACCILLLRRRKTQQRILSRLNVHENAKEAQSSQMYEAHSSTRYEAQGSAMHQLPDHSSRRAESNCTSHMHLWVIWYLALQYVTIGWSIKPTLSRVGLAVPT